MYVQTDHFTFAHAHRVITQLHCGLKYYLYYKLRRCLGHRVTTILTTVVENIATLNVSQLLLEPTVTVMCTAHGSFLTKLRQN